MRDVYRNIKRLRVEKGLSQEELAQKTGYSDRSAISKIEAGKVDLPLIKVKVFADTLGVKPSDLMGDDWSDKEAKRLRVYSDALTNMAKPGTDSNENPRAIRIPVLGRVAAGIPLDAVEDVIGWEEIPAAWEKQGDFIALKIHGDSMEPKMSEGDIVIVRIQPDVESGDVAIVRVNGSDATCKRVIKNADGITLVGLNPNFQPIFYSNSDIENLPVEIAGKVVELRAKF